jgi:hypothetical protein
MREWVIYAAIMSAIFLVFFPRNNAIGAVIGVLISGPLYLAFGFVMAKFGYTRKRLKDLRAEAKEQAAGNAADPGASSDVDTSGNTTPRPRPAPTSRTAGSSRPSSSSKRRR